MKLFTAMIAVVGLGSALPAHASDASAERHLAQNGASRASATSVRSPDARSASDQERKAPCTCDCGMTGGHKASRPETGLR